jgi:chemotaxis protein MotB
MEKSGRPIIIIKKKAAHHGHHGGAWKVAYADFVTAMMALFIVLWLLNSSKPVKDAVAGYFKDPSGTGTKTGTTMIGSGPAAPVSKDNMPKLKEELQKVISQMNDFEKFKNQVEMTVTPEGLRIDLLESASGTFFNSGNPRPNSDGKELLVTLAQQLGKLPNQLSIEGHTDSKPYSGTGEYGNWELSADRANAARRLMEQAGLTPNQVAQVRGYADHKLRNPADSLDPSNRRISVIVQYIEKDGEEAGSATGAAPEAKPTKSQPEGQ